MIWKTLHFNIPLPKDPLDLPADVAIACRQRMRADHNTHLPHVCVKRPSLTYPCASFGKLSTGLPGGDAALDERINAKHLLSYRRVVLPMSDGVDD